MLYAHPTHTSTMTERLTTIAQVAQASWNYLISFTAIAMNMTTWHRAIIQSKSRLSPKVTGLTLELLNPSAGFTFLPGQWIDFRPSPSCSTANNIQGKIGGYSMTSVPNQLPQLDLAVMTSRHPVAEWIVEQSAVNDIVDIRVGAGGVGINPLYSMMQQWCIDVAKRDDASRALDKMVEALSGRLSAVLTTTEGEDSIALSEDNVNIAIHNLILKRGRIDRSMIYDAIGFLQRTEQDEHNTMADSVFICGPPGMPESLKDILMYNSSASKGFIKSESDVHFEKWW
eukprot:scaffold76296_cov43-Cyclotella_meneghiniana.AAC.2